jgi:hypothetical protein
MCEYRCRAGRTAGRMLCSGEGGEAVLGSNAGESNAQVSLQRWTHRGTHATQQGEAVLGSNAGESNAQVSLQCWMHRRTHVTHRGEAVLGSNVGGAIR